MPPLTAQDAAHRLIAGQQAATRPPPVVEMRRSAHSDEFGAYRITPEGATVGERFAGYHGILTGNPTVTLTGTTPGTPGPRSAAPPAAEAAAVDGAADAEAAR